MEEGAERVEVIWRHSHSRKHRCGQTYHYLPHQRADCPDKDNTLGHIEEVVIDVEALSALARVAWCDAERRVHIHL